MAIKFNGSTGLIVAQDTTTLRPNNVSISAWFNLVNFAASSTIVCKPFSGPPWSSPFVSWMLRVNSTTALECDVGNGTSYSAFTTTISPAFTTNTWFHVAMTYDGTTVSSFVNGTRRGTNTTVAGNIGYTGRPVIIGGDFGAAPFADYVSGSISDVRIYNRALTIPEVLGLYASRCKYHSNTNGLIAYFPMDEKPIGSSSTNERILDQSGNNAFATGSGGGVFTGESTLTYGFNSGMT